MRLFEGTPFDVPPRCERCGELESDCRCEPEPDPQVPPESQTAHIRTEKRKKGKQVTVVSGLATENHDRQALLSKLKTACGAGGTVKEDTLEIQGDHVAAVAATLRKLGYRVKS